MQKLGRLLQRLAAPFRHAPIVAALLLVGLAFGRDAVAWVSLTQQRQALDRQLEQIASERAHLAKLEDKFKNNPVYVEDLIRSTFKVAAPGEIVIPLSSSKDLSPRYPWEDR